MSKLNASLLLDFQYIVQGLKSLWREDKMELHVLGPAFGLPSIDAECAAAVSLMQLHLGDEGSAWNVVPSHDTSLLLPYLTDGTDRFQGYDSIARHLADGLRKKGNTLDAKQHTNSQAISAFMSSRAPTLLAISLYVSFDNYRNATRPAFSKILPLPANYIIPPRRREAARDLTAHLGISSIDVDNVHEDTSNRPSGFNVGKEPQAEFETEAKGRASLLLPRKETLRSLLQRPEHAAIFKLQNLADNFFGPLQDMLGEEGDFLLGGQEPSDIDCLAYGYLALMLYPNVPQDWLAKTMKDKYARLAAYTSRMHSRLRLRTEAAEVMSLVKCQSDEDVQGHRMAYDMKLPWTKPTATSLTGALALVMDEILRHMPFLGPRAKVVLLREPKQSLWQAYGSVLAITTLASIVAGGYYALQTGLIVWPHGNQIQIFGRKRLSDYGHLGAALAGMSLLGQQATQDAAFHRQEAIDNPVHVEVAVEDSAMH